MKIIEKIKANKNKSLNIIIIILFFLLLCTVVSFLIPKDFTEYINNINSLNNKVAQLNKTISNNEEQIRQLNEKIANSEKQISDLTNSNTLLSDENQKLKEEKNELNERISQLQNEATLQTNSAPSVPSTSSVSSNNASQEYTVYITKTGKKYHKSGCSYLKQSKSAISINSAKAQGYTPCSRCNP